MEDEKKSVQGITTVEPDELKTVSGGGCWNSARFVAPDGHDVGCDIAWYNVQNNAWDFLQAFPDICPIDGKPHDPSGRMSAGGQQFYITCAKCGNFLDKNGRFSRSSGIFAD